ncbi:cellulase family glycosylhydrolase [Thermococcus sp. 9N3]|uniref:glycoside hydrolase family 5 protein n=1 Tax=Thermococcus sp. 9N3 TaxID=163002 RepID=UPI00143059DE|nr:cellulase family glycosylhydrolase [Thermococcus sp. 9N3]NJE48188.1 glycosyl hydrolase family 5 [Thermococcus sp. 9N3]
MKRLGVALILLILLAFLWSIHARVVENRTHTHAITPATNPSLQSPGNEPITAQQYKKLLGVGIDVDWMSFPRVHRYYFYWRSKGVNIPEYFKKAGFSNVRIRVGADVVNNKTALVQLGEIVNDTLRAGLIPIITYTAPELRNDPTSEKAQEHFVLWWKTVAEYFKGTSYLLSYDLLIESSGPIKGYPDVLNKVYAQTIAEIRKIDPYRLVFVTPARVSSPFYLKYLNVTNDGYTLAEWHIYAGGPKHCTYNMTLIESAINASLAWSKETGIPTWVGAWRPFWFSKKDRSVQCPIQADVDFGKIMASALWNAGIPYDINADVWFFNIENLTWYRDRLPVLRAVLHPSSST